LAVIAQHRAALMDEAKGADIAVVTRFEPAGIIVVAALDCDVIDALAEGPVAKDGGRVGVCEHQGAVSRGAAESLDQFSRQIGRKRAGAAAIHYKPLRSIGKLERQSRGRAL